MVSTSGVLPRPETLRIVQAETLDFLEQVAFFRNVRLVISAHGAGLVHCLWMPTNSVVIEISAGIVAKDNHFSGLCSLVLKHRYFRHVVKNFDDVDVQGLL